VDISKRRASGASDSDMASNAIKVSARSCSSGLNVPTPGKNRVHVDLALRLPQEEIERLLRLGASLVDERVDGEPHWREGNGIKWVVLRDPEGNEFCVGSIPNALQEQVSPAS